MAGEESEQLVKVFFELEQDEDGYPPVTCESMWATPVGNGLYRLGNIPFFASGVAYEDVVSAVRRDDGTRGFVEVVRPSGHSTLRVIVYEASEVPALRQELEALGCDTELSHIPNLMAVDVPPAVPLDSVRSLLETGTASERWEYEEACLGR
ncbi:DUF4265 domain-containing protein [Archangium violaceum]|uniref:DUF4265 domain-containing protein n=1 Tax=Archangium violaceum Cb vi76 TaxID=1406225 RepID=A0A084SLQ8_9BACT|nr:DUF4265 domain-containing protein [Archangium violaceum]KFA89393.1 hypothetical protein Q664_35515 [Archangium violaceum Cb vi76]